jgi:multicomponent Na+:H+ antiporter subunit B
MHHHYVLRVVAKILIPLILLFALYVQFHGDFGPGGGFQAGVIFAAAFVLYALVFGLGEAKKVASDRVLRMISAGGVLVYGGVGIANLILGNNFLGYNGLAAGPIAGQHLGILLVEAGVGMTVGAVMISLFFYFSS